METLLFEIDIINSVTVSKSIFGFILIKQNIEREKKRILDHNIK